MNRQCASQVIRSAAVALASAAFINWWVALPLLPSRGLGFAAMKPITALSVIGLGVALLPSGKTSRLAFAVGMAAATAGLLDLLDRFGFYLRINDLNYYL